MESLVVPECSEVRIIETTLTTTIDCAKEDAWKEPSLWSMAYV
jgi:hypothetical protein